MGRPHSDFVEPLILTPGGIPDNGRARRQARAELEDLVASGRLRYRETIAKGLGNAPDAFIGILQGRNLGKQLVKLT